MVEREDVVYAAVQELRRRYGIDVLLSALIRDVNSTINMGLLGSSVIPPDDDYQHILKHDLEIALDNYRNRYSNEKW